MPLGRPDLVAPGNLDQPTTPAEFAKDPMSKFWTAEQRLPVLLRVADTARHPDPIASQPQLPSEFLAPAKETNPLRWSFRVAHLRCELR